MKLNNLFLLAALAITGSAQGMTAGQVESKVQSAQRHEPLIGSFAQKFKEKEEKRVRDKYNNFHDLTEKFIEERARESDVLLPGNLRIFAHQVASLAQQIVVWDVSDKDARRKAEERMDTLIAFGEHLFSLDASKDAHIAKVCRIILVCLNVNAAFPRKLDDIVPSLVAQDLLSKEEAYQIADAFYDWSWF